MKLKVNEEACIGCGACASICPDVFDINDAGYAEVIVEEIKAEHEEEAVDAKEGCPTNAIVEVEQDTENEENAA